jgi:hypothetical protein
MTAISGKGGRGILGFCDDVLQSFATLLVFRQDILATV